MAGPRQVREAGWTVESGATRAPRGLGPVSTMGAILRDGLGGPGTASPERCGPGAGPSVEAAAGPGQRDRRLVLSGHPPVRLAAAPHEVPLPPLLRARAGLHRFGSLDRRRSRRGRGTPRLAREGRLAGAARVARTHLRSGLCSGFRSGPSSGERHRPLPLAAGGRRPPLDLLRANGPPADHRRRRAQLTGPNVLLRTLKGEVLDLVAWRGIDDAIATADAGVTTADRGSRRPSRPGAPWVSDDVEQLPRTEWSARFGGYMPIRGDIFVPLVQGGRLIGSLTAGTLPRGPGRPRTSRS